MHLLTSQLYICYNNKQKAPINTLFLSKAPQSQQITVTDIREKPVDIFIVLHRRQL